MAANIGGGESELEIKIKDILKEYRRSSFTGSISPFSLLFLQEKMGEEKYLSFLMGSLKKLLNHEPEAVKDLQSVLDTSFRVRLNIPFSLDMKELIGLNIDQIIEKMSETVRSFVIKNPNILTEHDVEKTTKELIKGILIDSIESVLVYYMYF